LQSVLSSSIEDYWNRIFGSAIVQICLDSLLAERRMYCRLPMIQCSI